MALNTGKDRAVIVVNRRVFHALSGMRLKKSETGVFNYSSPFFLLNCTIKIHTFFLWGGGGGGGGGTGAILLGKGSGGGRDVIRSKRPI